MREKKMKIAYNYSREPTKSKERPWKQSNESNMDEIKEMMQAVIAKMQGRGKKTSAKKYKS